MKTVRICILAALSLALVLVVLLVPANAENENPQENLPEEQNGLGLKDHAYGGGEAAMAVPSTGESIEAEPEASDSPVEDVISTEQPTVEYLVQGNVLAYPLEYTITISEDETAFCIRKTWSLMDDYCMEEFTHIEKESTQGRKALVDPDEYTETVTEDEHRIRIVRSWKLKDGSTLDDVSEIWKREISSASEAIAP